MKFGTNVHLEMLMCKTHIPAVAKSVSNIHLFFFLVGVWGYLIMDILRENNIKLLNCFEKYNFVEPTRGERRVGDSFGVHPYVH